jgi:SAM-dependent methyltransferase
MPISWTETAKFLDRVEPGRADAFDPHAYCYMLSNHSMPAQIKTASRTELLSGSMLISHLFRLALGGDGTAPSYRYWRESGGEWATEYDRRKMRHPYYHIAEMMILDHVVHHAPCRVLEWGCGTGRHLFNLAQIPGVDVFGFDQSVSMVTTGLGWATPQWRASHVATGEPTGRLPYPDDHFDIVYTSEALLNTRPEDLLGRLAELIRVCRGHILHIEAPPAWRGGYSPWCGGCWGHDLVRAYRALGVYCEVATAGCTRQTPYLVVIRPESLRWTASPAMLALYRRLEAQIEEGFARGGVPPDS